MYWLICAWYIYANCSSCWQEADGFCNKSKLLPSPNRSRRHKRVRVFRFIIYKCSLYRILLFDWSNHTRFNTILPFSFLNPVHLVVSFSRTTIHLRKSIRSHNSNSSNISSFYSSQEKCFRFLRLLPSQHHCYWLQMPMPTSRTNQA